MDIFNIREVNTRKVVGFKTKAGALYLKGTIPGWVSMIDDKLYVTMVQSHFDRLKVDKEKAGHVSEYIFEGDSVTFTPSDAMR